MVKVLPTLQILDFQPVIRSNVVTDLASKLGMTLLKTFFDTNETQNIVLSFIQRYEELTNDQKWDSIKGVYSEHSMLSIQWVYALHNTKFVQRIVGLPVKNSHESSILRIYSFIRTDGDRIY